MVETYPHRKKRCKIEPLNMPDFNNGLQNPPRGWPLKILVYERNKFWRKFYVLFQARMNNFLMRSTPRNPQHNFN